jgi:hypothetical protein
MGHTSVGANNSFHLGYRNNTTLTLAQFNNDLDANVAGHSTTNISLLSGFLDVTNGHYLYRSGVLLNSNNDRTPLSNFTAGGVLCGNILGFTYYRGNLFEVLLYPSNQTANRVAIEADIMSYYGIS